MTAMDVELLEPHPQKVIEEFRQGRFDGLEIIARADEKAFFELCFKQKILDALAKEMPTARKKEEVPRDFVLAANLSLKLHGEHAFHGWERVVRCGGLLAAMEPGFASKHLDARGKGVVLRCTGFNAKNHYDRSTPCDQDMLRKFVRDVAAQQWTGWFNAAMQEVFQSYGFFDPEGVFVGDASYLFVPDNDAYEGSVLMWFDAHNHPVDYESLSPAQRRKAHLERCYKWVSLLHLRRQNYVWAAVAVVPGNAHELPVLYELVEGFVARLGPGVMKKLIIDRGLIDGGRIAYTKTTLGVDVIVPLKHGMDLWEDAWALSERMDWVPRMSPEAPADPPALRADLPPAIARRECTRQQTLAKKKALCPPPDPATVLVSSQLCAVKDLRWGELPLAFHVVVMRELYADGHTDQWALLTTEDFADPQGPPRDYARRPTIEERHRQIKCFYDLTDFHSRSFNAVVAQVVFVLLSYTLRQWQLWKSAHTEMAGLHPERISRSLNLHDQHVVIYHGHAYVQVPLLSFTRMVLELEGDARRNALAIIRRMERSFLTPPTNPRPPP
jgi:hypothetical protein